MAKYTKGNIPASNDINDLRNVINGINRRDIFYRQEESNLIVKLLKHDDVIFYNYNSLTVTRSFFGKNKYLKEVLEMYPNYLFMIVPKFQCDRVDNPEYSSSFPNVKYTVEIYEDWIKTPFGKKYFETYGNAGFYKIAPNVLNVPLSIINAFSIHNLTIKKYDRENYINEQQPPKEEFEIYYV